MTCFLTGGQNEFNKVNRKNMSKEFEKFIAPPEPKSLVEVKDIVGLMKLGNSDIQEKETERVVAELLKQQNINQKSRIARFLV